jgi:Uma2 family endonuclease
MKTVVLASCTPEEAAMLAERRRLDQDRRDEVWQGEYHMVPAPHSRHGRLGVKFIIATHPRAIAAGLEPMIEFNVGEPDDFRVPDIGYLPATQPDTVWQPTAAIVVELLSPGDEAWQKFDFYAAHRVDEYVLLDGDANCLHWFALRDGRYERVDRSELLDLAVAEVTEAIDWS